MVYKDTCRNVHRGAFKIQQQHICSKHKDAHEGVSCQTESAHLFYTQVLYTISVHCLFI